MSVAAAGCVAVPPPPEARTTTTTTSRTVATTSPPVVTETVVTQTQTQAEFAPPPGRALVYIYRDDESGIATPIALNGTAVGSMSGRSYFHWTVPPGTHTITLNQNNPGAFTVTAEAGHVYFVRQIVASGSTSPKVRMELVDAPQGQAAVRTCRLIASATTS